MSSDRPSWPSAARARRPVALTDAEGNNSLATRSMQSYCLGFDHRIIDGADAGRLITEFKRNLEAWDREFG
jgi:pyruvate dehydrogenase E2 component (dihydrolipoamide acetyltransferase)